MPRQPIAVGSSEARSRPLMASRVVNLYPETPPRNSRAPSYPGENVRAVHYGTPGLKAPLISAAGPARAARFFTTATFPQGYVYVLINSTLYRIDQNGTATACTGSAIPANGNAMMSSNRTQLALMVNGSSFTVAEATSTVVTALTDVDYQTASSIDYLDGYGIWTKASSDQFFLSALNDFTSINALDFATAEAASDGLVRAIVDHRILWLFGESTTEIWVNTGVGRFPFERQPGALMEKGCAATLSPAKLKDAGVAWLGDDRVIYRSQGFQGLRISTTAVEEAIRDGTVSDAYGLSYHDGGHLFYVLTFPSLGRTFAYDITTGVWHERQSSTILPYAIWNVTCVVEAWGKIYAGTTDGNFGELDLDTYSDASSPIRRVIRSAPFYSNGKRAILDEVEVEMELGTGLNTGQGSDPQIMLRVSKDGGASWGNERSVSFGVTGERKKRVTFNKLGKFREAMLEFSISDPVKVAIYGMRYTAREMAA